MLEYCADCADEEENVCRSVGANSCECSRRMTVGEIATRPTHLSDRSLLIRVLR